MSRAVPGLTSKIEAVAMANYVPTMSKKDLLELREILKRTIKNAEEKGDGESIGLVGTYAELEEVEERLKEFV